jgi:hypothetical protein
MATHAKKPSFAGVLPSPAQLVVYHTPWSNLGKVVGPALLFRPQLLVMSLGVHLELELVRVDNLFSAVLAL